jgi:outer membrane protein assembly factor BamB
MTRFYRAILVTALLCVSSLMQNSLRADDWPQWRGPNRDGVWRETGIVEKFKDKQLKLDWRVEIGSGYGGPTIADGRVFVTDRMVEPTQVERVHCFDWKTGHELWTDVYDCRYSGVGYDAGPRAAVTIDDGRAYALGAMGNLHCLDAAKGAILWKKDLLKQYDIRMPIWGIAAAPLVDGQLVIVQVGGEKACIVAFDKATGDEKWKSLDDRASYSAPIIVQQAGRRVLVCWTGDSIAGLDPASGGVLWRYPFKPSRMVLNVATPVVHDDRLFVTAFYDGSLMLRLDQKKLAVEKIWSKVGLDEQRTKALQSIIATPYFDGSNVYGVDSYGQLRCLDAATGERVWESQAAVPKARWATIQMVLNGQRMFLFNERGQLIIASLSPDGYHEISRTQVLEPTTGQLNLRGGVCWSHPGFAYKHIFARNDRELVCGSLAAGD